MIKFAQKAIFVVLALPATLRAVVRLNRHSKLRFDMQAQSMRNVSAFSVTYLCQPHYLAATVDRLVPILPPRSYGPCLKRSLLLLDLWSRCGLDPVLHLGAISEDQEQAQDRSFHAWVTTENGGPCTSANGHEEIWSG